MCKYIDRCPSASGWCNGKTATLSESCGDFIFGAFENMKNKCKYLVDSWESCAKCSDYTKAIDHIEMTFGSVY